jgi:hypothetical protein
LQTTNALMTPSRRAKIVAPAKSGPFVVPKAGDQDRRVHLGNVGQLRTNAQTAGAAAKCPQATDAIKAALPARPRNLVLHRRFAKSGGGVVADSCVPRGGYAYMIDRAKFIAALGASGVTGVVLAVFVLTVGSPATSDDSLGATGSSGATGKDTGAIAVCSIASAAPDPTFYSEMTKINRRMHEAMEIVASGNVDRDFMWMMIPHHQGAVDMALVQLKYGRDERLRRLAQSIIVEQGQEIAYMHSLLDTSLGEPTTNRGADQ